MGPKENVFHSNVRILRVFCGLQFHVYAHLLYSSVFCQNEKSHVAGQCVGHTTQGDILLAFLRYF
jgi:hypothetical protein